MSYTVFDAKFQAYFRHTVTVPTMRFLQKTKKILTLMLATKASKNDKCQLQ